SVHQLRREWRDILRELTIEVRRVSHEHLGDAGDLGRLLGNTADVRTRDQSMHFAELRRRGDRGKRRVADLAVAMLDQQQHAHCTTPKAFNFPTSSSTEPTFSPAWRLGGSATFSVSSRRAIS